MQFDHTPTIREILDGVSDAYGDKTFIRFKRNGIVEERSYNRVRSDSLAICRWIRSISENRMHIAIIGKTNYEYITCMTGVLVSGNVIVPFAPDITAKEAGDLFNRADIDAILFDEEFKEKTIEIQKLCPRIKIAESLGNESFFTDIYQKYSDTSEYAYLSDIKVDENECAMIMYTSGTTGIRKGVMLSTKGLVSNNMYTELEYSDDYCSLNVLPMHHVFCFVGDYLKNLQEGISLCLNGDIRDMGDSLQTFQPTVMRIVPLIAKSLLQKVRIVMKKYPELTPPQAAAKVFGNKIKWVYSGGAYLNPEIAKAYDEFGFFVRQGYGMTEAGCRVSVPYIGQSPESVGKVLSICQVRIQNGEIQVKTPSVMMGYYKMPEETAAMFTEDGWLKTGDVGYLDEDNQLFLTGRMKNIIVLSNGENVSPEALEKKFECDPMVAEAIVSEKNDNLVIEVFPNIAFAEANGISDVLAYMNELLKKVNATAKPSHIISSISVRDTPFAKTSSGKTKRS